MLLRAKLYRVTVTEADLEYDGPCGIDDDDDDLLDAADMRDFELIELYK